MTVTLPDAGLGLLQGGYLLQAAAGSALGRQVRATTWKTETVCRMRAGPFTSQHWH